MIVVLKLFEIDNGEGLYEFWQSLVNSRKRRMNLWVVDASMLYKPITMAA